jgi:hypothetical protein
LEDVTRIWRKEAEERNAMDEPLTSGGTVRPGP